MQNTIYYIYIQIYKEIKVEIIYGVYSIDDIFYIANIYIYIYQTLVFNFKNITIK